LTCLFFAGCFWGGGLSSELGWENDITDKKIPTKQGEGGWGHAPSILKTRQLKLHHFLRAEGEKVGGRV